MQDRRRGPLSAGNDARRGQEEYRVWLDSLPDNLAASATAEALRAICKIDLSELEAVGPPRDFGRDG